MFFVRYDKNLKTFSRELRNNSTLSEVLLWQELRAGNIKGYKFNRQKPLGRYIVDLYCKRINLVIEIDGDSHDQAEALLRDDLRQQELEKHNLSFLRFDDAEVKNNISHVLQEIYYFIDQYELNPPDPLVKGE